MSTLITPSFTIKATASLSRISIDFTGDPLAIETVLSLNSTLTNFTRNKFSLLKKITAIGYLMAEPVAGEERKIILFHDDTTIETGRNGKSSIASVLRQFTTSYYALGHFDCYWLDEVTPDIRLFIVDDPRSHAEQMIYMIRGDWRVLRKYSQSVSIPKDKTPKVLMTVGHISNEYLHDSIVRIPFTGIFNNELKRANELMHEEVKSRRAEYQQFINDCVAAYKQFGLINYNL